MSVVVHEIGVEEPDWKIEPEAGKQIVLLMPDASYVVGAYVTVAFSRPADGVVAILEGHVMFGLVVSITVTVNEHEEESCVEASVVVQTTRVVVFKRKFEPDAGKQVVVVPDAVGA